MGYYKLIKFVNNIVDSEQVDLIHFLNFDPMVKHFGLFLRRLKNYPIIITFHHYRYSVLRDFSRKKYILSAVMGW